VARRIQNLAIKYNFLKRSSGLWRRVMLW